MSTQVLNGMMDDTSFSETNHLVRLARRGRRLTHPLLIVMLSVVFIFGSQVLGSLYGIPLYNLLFPAVAVVASPSLLSGLQRVYAPVFLFVPVYLMLWAWLAWFERRPFWTLGFELKGGGAKILRGFAIGLLMSGGAVGSILLLGGLFGARTVVHAQGLGALIGVLLALVGFLVQASAEEALCRGWVLPAIAARLHVWSGIMISALIFSGLHGLNPDVSALVICNLFLYGIFAALYALREGSIWGVCAFHTVWNWSQTNVFRVNTPTSAPDTFFTLRIPGGSLLNGGSYGPEGSLVATCVFLLGILVIFCVSKRRVYSCAYTE